MDGKNLTLLVALDISAAFDALEHDILLRRLERTFGISDFALTWIKSYLSERTQFVKINDGCSEKLPCKYGVPQGSVLGPILFALHVSPVGNVINKAGLKHHQYADDTQLYVSFKSSDKQYAINQTEKTADAVRQWFVVNGLQLNPDKTEAMFLGTPQNILHSSISDTSTLDISGSSVKVTDQIKSLGVYIDSRLSFKKQVSSICRASYSNIKALRKIRSTLDNETANTVACAIVSTRIDYCNSVLIGTTEENLKKLQRVQNSLARVVSGSRRSDHITPVLSDLHWLPVRERINFKFGCLAFKSKLLGQPSYLSDLLHPYIPVRNLRSASSAENNFCVPFTRLKITSRAFSVAAPRIWNEIPAVIRNSDDVKNFGKQLKTFLFSRAFKTV